ncbi:phenol hydroxylase [Diplocarpon mali]|nr:phenol hydroxylase [Diplocarpon mali]
MAPGSSDVDVLIIGTGPAGLMAATWMARCAAKTRIVDTRGIKIFSGPAMHTHSPKAGQGMNISLQDTLNVGWKIAGVVNGTASRSIFKTYQSQRRHIDRDLVAFHHRFSLLFSGRPAKDAMDDAGISMDYFKDANVVVAKEGDAQEQGDYSDVGIEKERGVVLNQADARSWHFQQTPKSDGRWRIMAFAENFSDAKQVERANNLGKILDSPGSFIKRFTPAGKEIDSLFDILTIHYAKRAEAELHTFPVSFDDESYPEGFGNTYGQYGAGRKEGCVVIPRPEQYVGWIGDLEDVDGMDLYFSAFMIAKA